MALVVFALPSPPPPAAAAAPATRDRWRLAQAATRAVGLPSVACVFANFAGMVFGFLSCGDGVEWSVSRATQGDKCPVFRASFAAFRIASCSMVVASRLLDLLRTCEALSEAKKQKAAARVKSLGYAIIIEHIVPVAFVFLVIVGALLESRSAKGSIMETAGSVILYGVLGMMALIATAFAAVLVVLFVVVLCSVMAITAMVVWE